MQRKLRTVPKAFGIATAFFNFVSFCSKSGKDAPRSEPIICLRHLPVLRLVRHPVGHSFSDG